jgi:hypothetical protein
MKLGEHNSVLISSSLLSAILDINLLCLVIYLRLKVVLILHYKKGKAHFQHVYSQYSQRALGIANITEYRQRMRPLILKDRHRHHLKWKARRIGESILSLALQNILEYIYIFILATKNREITHTRRVIRNLPAKFRPGDTRLLFIIRIYTQVWKY